MRSDDADGGTAGLAANGKTAREDVNVVTVFVSETEFSFVGPCPARDALVEAIRQRLVVRVQQPFPRPDVRFDLVAVGLVSEHLFPPWRVHHGAGFEVPVPYAFLRAGKREGQSFFALAQRGFRALALGDVTEHHLHRGRFLSIEQRARDFDIEGNLVPSDNPGVEPSGRVPGPDTPEVRLDPGATLWRKHVEQRASNDLRWIGRTTQLHGGGIEECDPCIADDADGHG